MVARVFHKLLAVKLTDGWAGLIAATAATAATTFWLGMLVGFVAMMVS